jgi:hypothetical protein
VWQAEDVLANTVFVHALYTPGEPIVRELDLVMLLFFQLFSHDIGFGVAGQK